MKEKNHVETVDMVAKVFLFGFGWCFVMLSGDVCGTIKFVRQCFLLISSFVSDLIKHIPLDPCRKFLSRFQFSPQDFRIECWVLNKNHYRLSEDLCRISFHLLCIMLFHLVEEALQCSNLDDQMASRHYLLSAQHAT